jgi:predicted DNA-binding transcriptional regulator AlpA
VASFVAMTTRELYSAKKVSVVTGWSEGTIYQLVREKKFPKQTHVAKEWRWASSDIENWIEEQIEKDRSQERRPSSVL